MSPADGTGLPASEAGENSSDAPSLRESPQLSLADLLARMALACDRAGKPSGVHMVDAYEMMARHGRASSHKPTKEMAETYDLAATCIRNENALFEELRSAALGLVAALESNRNDGSSPQNNEPSNAR